MSLNLVDATPRRLFAELEWATGYPIDTSRCECIDWGKRFTLRVRDMEAGKVLLLAGPSLFGGGHCGEWGYKTGRVLLNCGRSEIELSLPFRRGGVRGLSGDRAGWSV